MAERPLLFESDQPILLELTRAPKRSDEQSVEVVHAAFTEDRVSTALVRLRAQTPLHRLANRDVLPLNFVGELDRLLQRLANLGAVRIRKEPLEDGERPIMSKGEDYVGREIVRIDVQHQIRKNPEILRLIGWHAGAP